MSKPFKHQDLAKRLGISKSYLSMILSGKRKCPAEYIEVLQSTQGIHKVVKNDIWSSTHNPEVVGSNPTPATNFQNSIRLINNSSQQT